MNIVVSVFCHVNEVYEYQSKFISYCVQFIFSWKETNIGHTRVEDTFHNYKVVSAVE